MLAERACYIHEIQAGGCYKQEIWAPCLHLADATVAARMRAHMQTHAQAQACKHTQTHAHLADGEVANTRRGMRTHAHAQACKHTHTL